MSVDQARRAVRHLLRISTGSPTPEWRTCYSTDGSDEPTGIAPVCPDETHAPDDGNAYNCCPDPVVEVDSSDLAAYLVELLNADREQSAGGES